MKSVGFIGLGTMGFPMARNLIKKGYPLTVYNRTPEKAAELVALGAVQVDTPAEAARAAEVLFTNVSDDAALLELLQREGGILEGARTGLTVVDCSTVAPETSRTAAQELAKRGAGFLDAPVTGSRPGAENGTLVFMVGGSEELLNRHMDLFETLGSRILHMGPSGAGSYTKLAHNTIVGINAAALVEGMSFAAKAGVDPDKLLTIILNGGAGSKQAELKGRKIIEHDFSVQFSLGLMLKDMLLAARETARFQMPSPMLHSATSLYQMGLAKGLGQQDLCSIVECYEEWLDLKISSGGTPSAQSDGRSS
ncbi:NAD(P)-dependent oxidoreductase [Paenibacillus sp. CC-CFT747]|nr:NAD(P)-dependent oxidoreductase [Paenibacillus sp. CC-CFT747]